MSSVLSLKVWMKSDMKSLFLFFCLFWLPSPICRHSGIAWLQTASLWISYVRAFRHFAVSRETSAPIRSNTKMQRVSWRFFFFFQPRLNLNSWVENMRKSVFSTSLAGHLDWSCIYVYCIKCDTWRKWVVCSGREAEWFVARAETQKSEGTRKHSKILVCFSLSQNAYHTAGELCSVGKSAEKCLWIPRSSQESLWAAKKTATRPQLAVMENNAREIVSIEVCRRNAHSTVWRYVSPRNTEQLTQSQWGLSCTRVLPLACGDVLAADSQDIWCSSIVNT